MNSGSVDISIFCLSLMGTNIRDFLLEGHRVLKARFSCTVLRNLSVCSLIVFCVGYLKRAAQDR